ncbi:hypothetical protein FB451DRAFT_1411245 [Mycena latifolia]|nr:hypothetical protein FB451DRAFT_1411245 [Mycena latifolia]
MVGTIVQMLALAALAIQFAIASPAPALITIVAPPGDPGIHTPLPGAIIGVDSLGRTTYVVSDSSGGDVATATLVEGSDYVSYTISASTTMTVPTLSSWILDVPQTTAPGSSLTKTSSASQQTAKSIFGAFVALVVAFQLA